MQDFQQRDVDAWEAFLESRKDRPYPRPRVRPEEESIEMQAELERKYLGSEVTHKYGNVRGRVTPDGPGNAGASK